MATTYFAWTFPVRKEDVSSGFKSLNDVSSLLDIGVAKQRTLMSASRNNWIVGALQNVAGVFGNVNLTFLTQLFFILDGNQISSAINEIEIILLAAENKPALIADAIGGGWKKEDILSALRSSTESLSPSTEPAGEEGDGPWYLFSYLKSLLSILHQAKANDWYIVHVQHEH